MTQLSHNLIPLKRSDPQFPIIYDPDEPRPGMDPLNDPFDEEYPTAAADTEYISEYHHSNMHFWGYMLIAFAIAVLATAALYTGVTQDWYKELDLPPGTNNSEIIVIGNIVFLVLITWVAYHLHNNCYSDNVKQGSVFFLGASYLLFLAWAATLYGSGKPNNASLYLVLLSVLMAIGMWVIWDMPGFKYKKYTLLLAGMWLIYLLYYTVGILVLDM